MLKDIHTIQPISPVLSATSPTVSNAALLMSAVLVMLHHLHLLSTTMEVLVFFVISPMPAVLTAPLITSAPTVSSSSSLSMEPASSVELSTASTAPMTPAT